MAPMRERDEQSIVDRELRRLFEALERPAPSFHFNRVLRERLRAEQERQRRRGRCLAVMQGYWIAACAASAIVMLLVHWPSGLGSGPIVCALGVVFGMALLPALILLRSLRIGPVRLILETTRTFRG